MGFKLLIAFVPLIVVFGNVLKPEFPQRSFNVDSVKPSADFDCTKEADNQKCAEVYFGTLLMVGQNCNFTKEPESEKELCEMGCKIVNCMAEYFDKVEGCPKLSVCLDNIIDSTTKTLNNLPQCKDYQCNHSTLQTLSWAALPLLVVTALFR